MKHTFKLLVLSVSVFLLNCEGSKTDKFPMEKPFWDVQDYDHTIREIEFRTPENEKYPTLNDPETSPIFNKLIDHQNVSVVVNDNTLGLRHRAEFTSNLFDKYRDMTRLYSVMDREDKYVYDREFVEILKFGLYLQIHYFKLGNDKIRQESDNENENKNIISSNEQTILENFNFYLDNINNEKSFSDESLKSYAAGIDEYFTLLMETFPEAKYQGMLTKAENMEKKAQNQPVKDSLSKLISRLKAKTEIVSETQPIGAIN